MSPQIRATPLEASIPAINLEAIQGFLVQNRVVTPGVLDAAPYVIQGDSERLVVGGGDRLYVRGALPESESYSFVRKGELYRDPVTNEVLGLEATYIGLGRVIASEGDITTFFVNSSREEVQIGDRVLPTEERKVDSTFFPSAPRSQDRRRFDRGVRWRHAGRAIRRGRDRSRRTRRPRVRKRACDLQTWCASEGSNRARHRPAAVRARGLLMVFRVFEKLSYGLVLATERPLAVGDEVKNP